MVTHYGISKEDIQYTIQAAKGIVRVVDLIDLFEYSRKIKLNKDAPLAERMRQGH